MKNFLLIHNLIKSGFYVIGGEGSTKQPHKITLTFGHGELKNVSSVCIALDKSTDEYNHIKDLLNI